MKSRDIPAEAILPLISEFDPPLQAEGSIDPLGLYSIGDALGVRLAPGVRERQSKPRYLTLALAGMAACGDRLSDLGSHKRLPAWLVFEWLVVISLVQRLKGTPQFQGIPGREKVLATLSANDVVCMRTYLKTPTVFGFHGIYRVLGTKSGLFDADGHPMHQGYRVLQAWQADQRLAGYVEGTGPGRDLRRLIEKTVRSGLEAGHLRGVSGELSRLIAAHLNPHELGQAEREALWTALTHNDAMRGEYATLLTTFEGQEAWREAAGSEATYQTWLMPKASAPMQQLLKCIHAFEQLARLLSDAFDESRWRMTQERIPVESAWLGTGAAMQRACREVPAAYADAVAELGEIDPALRLKAEHSLAWAGEPCSCAIFASKLLAHHERVQRAKPPNGKRPWFDSFGDGRVAIRPAYTLDEFVPRPEEFVHAYRTRPLWSFAADLRRVRTDEEVA